MTKPASMNAPNRGRAASLWIAQGLVALALLCNSSVARAWGPSTRLITDSLSAQTLRDPNARRRAVVLVGKGNKKLVGGYYAEALALFQQAFRIYPSPKLHFNLAQTYAVLARPLQALSHYERFLKRVGRKVDNKRWILAHQEIYKLLGQIATLQIQVNVPGAKVSVDGKTIGQTPIKQALRLGAGRHVIVLAKLGHARQVINLLVRSGQNLTRRIKLLTEREALAKRRLFQELQSRRRATQARLARARAKERQRRQKLRRTLVVSGWTALGLGLAAGVVAGVLGGLFERDARALEDAEDQVWLDGWSARKARADRYRVGFYTSLGIGGALVVTGTVLAILGTRVKLLGNERAPKVHKKVVLMPALGPRFAGASLQLRF